MKKMTDRNEICAKFGLSLNNPEHAALIESYVSITTEMNQIDAEIAKIDKHIDTLQMVDQIIDHDKTIEKLFAERNQLRLGRYMDLSQQKRFLEFEMKVAGQEVKLDEAKKGFEAAASREKDAYSNLDVLKAQLRVQQTETIRAQGDPEKIAELDKQRARTMHAIKQANLEIDAATREKREARGKVKALERVVQEQRALQRVNRADSEYSVVVGEMAVLKHEVESLRKDMLEKQARWEEVQNNKLLQSLPSSQKGISQFEAEFLNAKYDYVEKLKEAYDKFPELVEKAREFEAAAIEINKRDPNIWQTPSFDEEIKKYNPAEWEKDNPEITIDLQEKQQKSALDALREKIHDAVQAAIGIFQQDEEIDIAQIGAAAGAVLGVSAADIARDGKEIDLDSLEKSTLTEEQMQTMNYKDVGRNAIEKNINEDWLPKDISEIDGIEADEIEINSKR